MTAQELLKMIETVDPNDTAKLDEIDARFWCWINGHNFLYRGKEKWPSMQDFIGSNRDNFYVRHGANEKQSGFDYVPTYTRSRDQLKQIRPDGWKFLMCLKPIERQWQCSMYDPQHDGIYSQSPMLHTEELAELHAIIQAIEYERSIAKSTTI